MSADRHVIKKFSLGLLRRAIGVFLVCFLLVSAVFQSSKGQNVLGMGESAFLYDLRDYGMNVVIDDHVTGGCLPNPRSLETSVKAALTRNEFQLIDEDSRLVRFVVRAFGEPILTSAGEIGCAVDLEIYVVQIIRAFVPYTDGQTQTLVNYIIPIEELILTGAKSEMQYRIEIAATDAADELSLRVTKAIGKLEKSSPETLSKIKEQKKRQAKQLAPVVERGRMTEGRFE